MAQWPGKVAKYLDRSNTDPPKGRLKMSSTSLVEYPACNGVWTGLVYRCGLRVRTSGAMADAPVLAVDKTKPAMRS